MSYRPTDIPSFATNTNYATGPDVGTATRVKPSVGELADGFKNGLANAPDAQSLNWAVGLLSDWATYLSGMEILRYQLNDDATVDTGETFDTTSYPGWNSFRISQDGTRMVAADQDNYLVLGFTLRVPGNLRWVAQDAGSLDISAQTTSPRDVTISEDGDLLYVMGDGKIFAYSLSTPFVPSTGTHVATLDLTSVITDSQGFAFNRAGTRLYFLNDDTPINTFELWNLSTPWDITTATDSGQERFCSPLAKSLDVSDDETFFFTGGVAGGISVDRIETAGDLSTNALYHPADYLPGGLSAGDAHFICNGGHLYFSINDTLYHYHSTKIQAALGSMDPVPTVP